jgi:hypothetical protein
MKYKISNERLTKLIFRLLNKELEHKKFRVFIDSYAFVDLTADDEHDGLMVLVDDEEIKLYPALYKTVMMVLGMDIYQFEPFLHSWASMELRNKMPLGKSYVLTNKYVDVIY